jgi:hypothetical protein
MIEEETMDHNTALFQLLELLVKIAKESHDASPADRDLLDQLLAKLRGTRP